MATQKAVFYREISMRNFDCAEVFGVWVSSDPFDEALIRVNLVDTVFQNKGGPWVVRVMGSVSFKGESRCAPAFNTTI